MRLFSSKRCEVMFGAAVVVAFACCLGCGSGGSSGDPALVGTWVGTEASSSTVWTFTVTSSDADVKIAGVQAYKGTYTVDTSSDPKRITLAVTDSTNSLYIGKTANGIYKMEGSTLTVAINQPGNAARPVDFTPGGDAAVFTLTKQ